MNSDNDKQIARMIYHKFMSNMKFTLDLEEYSYKDQGRDDPRYRFFKKQLMQHTYDTIRSLFVELEQLGFIEKTDYEEDLKQGYAETTSGGSGYVNTKKIDNLLQREKIKKIIE